MNFSSFIRVATALHCLAILFVWNIGAPNLAAQSPPPPYQTDCGNDDDNDNDDGDNCPGCQGGGEDSTQEGDSDTSSGDDANDCDDTGANPINPHRGNVHREVVDISTFGPAPIQFTRQANSRNATHGGFNDFYWELGYRQIWQHNWNYEMRQQGTVATQYILLRYPNGNEYDFKPLSYPVAVGTQLIPPAWNTDRIYVTALSTQGAISACTVLTAKGEELDFLRSTSPAFHLTQKRNGLGWSWTCTYTSTTSTGRLTRITNNFGRWIQIDRETGSDGVVRISQVSTSDGRSLAYHYAAWATSGQFVLSSIDYPGGEHAIYNHVTSDPTLTNARPLLATAVDPAYRHGGPGSQIKYVYNYNAIYGNSSGFVPGTLLEERNAVTDQQIISFPLGGGAYPKIMEGDGVTEVTRKYTSGRLTTKQDGALRTIVFTRDNNGFGFVASKTDDRGAVTHYVRDYAGRVLTRTDALAHTRSHTYNAKGFMLTKTDELSHTLIWARDSGNQPTQKTYPDSSFETWTNYNANSQPLNHRLRSGGNESFVYDSLGNMTSHTDAAGKTTTYTYYASGLVSSVTDARLFTTSYTYNWRGQMLTLTHPDTTTITYHYDPFGNRDSVKDELNHTTSYTFDEYNRVKTVTDPLTHTTTYEYGRAPGCNSCSYANTISRITSPGGRVTTYSYDGSGLRTCQTVGAGTADAATTLYDYDPAKNRTTVTDPNGKIWHYGYDDNHRRTSAIDPLGNTTIWGYDEHGNKTSETRPDNGITTGLYDSRNRLTQVTDPAQNVTQMTYDSADNLKTLKDARNNVYTYGYDLLSRRLSLTYPGNSAESWTYDPAGNVQTYTTRAGQTKTFTYDSRNRETDYDWNDGQTSHVHKNYDAAGRLIDLNNAASLLSYGYDAANRVLSEYQQISGAPGGKTVVYEYDADNNRTRIYYPSGDGASYTYTSRKQISNISWNYPLGFLHDVSASYTYDFNGNVLTRSSPNGTTSNYSYDEANRLKALDHLGGTTSFARFDYLYNSVSNRMSRTETNSGKTVMDAYDYDPIDQVTGAKYNFDAQGNTQDRLVNYAHDPVGNRMSVTDNGSSTGYATDSLNQYTSVGNDHPSYDANGNLKSQGVWNYAYDAENRLVTASNGTTGYAFTYDGRNRCASRTAPATFKYCYYDGWNLIEELDASWALLARYLHGAKTDELVARNEGVPHYYYADALGSTVALTSGFFANPPVERYTYDIFGAPTFRDGSGKVISASAYDNRSLFTGREYLTEMGLYDYRHRIYSPELGRFLQADPIGFLGGDVNLYRYARNGVPNLTDPNGEDAALVIGLLIAAGLIYEGYHYYELGQVAYGAADAQATATQKDLEGFKAEAEGDGDRAKQLHDDADKLRQDAMKKYGEAACKAAGMAAKGPLEAEP